MADRTSSHPIAAKHGGPHVLAPIAMEDGDTLGAHARALLRALVVTALANTWKEPSGAEETRGHLTWDAGVAMDPAVATPIVNLCAHSPFAPSHSPPPPRNTIGAEVHLNKVQHGLDVSVIIHRHVCLDFL